MGLTRSKKGWQIVHRCERCGAERKNRVAERAPAADDIDAIVALLARDSQRFDNGASARGRARSYRKSPPHSEG